MHSRPRKQQVQRPWAAIYVWCSRNSKASVARVSEGRMIRKGVQWGCRGYRALLAIIRASELILLNLKDIVYHFLICCIIYITFSFQQFPISD